MVALPLARASLVFGPPAARLLNRPTLRPYVSSRPGWQNPKLWQFAGPTSTVARPEHVAAKSERVFTSCLSANAAVTAKPFWALADAG